MTEALVHRLQARGELTAEALDHLIAAGPVPFVEPSCSTFLYRGDADAVRLQHWGVGLPPNLDFVRLLGSDLWYLVLELPPGSRLEYKLEVAHPDGARLVEDPLNPIRANNPYGANSVCRAAGYAVPAWAHHDPDVPEGAIKDHTLSSEALGRPAHTSLYLPAGFDTASTARYPLLVVHDGGDYLHYAQLQTVLDNLIHLGLVPPVVAAFSHPGERLVEYADDPRHARFLAEELVPVLEAELPLVAGPGGRYLMGASFGAVASLAGAWRYPGTYGGLLLQSGSFASSRDGCPPRPGPIWQPVKDFVDAFVGAPSRVGDRVFVGCGRFEPLLCDNRVLVPDLRSTGMEVHFVEALDGHCWESWRDQLGDALPWLLHDRG